MHPFSAHLPFHHIHDHPMPDPNFPALKADLAGRTVLVVGSNVGIGFEAAKHFARMNPNRLIVTCRNQEKGVRTVEGELCIFVVFSTYMPLIPLIPCSDPEGDGLQQRGVLVPGTL